MRRDVVVEEALHELAALLRIRSNGVLLKDSLDARDIFTHRFVVSREVCRPVYWLLLCFRFD